MNGSKRALIFGIGGQDGSYLAQLLFQKGYDSVHGVYRRCSSENNLWRIEPLLKNSVWNSKLVLHQGDLCDAGSLQRIIALEEWDEIYNEADQDHVGWSWYLPSYAMQVTSVAVGQILEIIRRTCPNAKFFQPCSATMFGNQAPPQTEQTPFAPESPYACAKLAAYFLCQHYRREWGLHVSTAILYNHDSVRRRGDYLLHIVCKGAVECAAGKRNTVLLNNVDQWVDIGHAPEYVDGIWRLMQLDKPDDVILASGNPITIREICRMAFEQVDLNWEQWVKVRPSDKPATAKYSLTGCITKAQKLIGWEPKMRIEEFIPILVQHYIEGQS